MPKPDSIALVAAAEADGLESLLVGGNAVNLYAYRRTTFDVDLLVREREVARWLSFFEQRGYEIFHRTPNFLRLRFAADPAQAIGAIAASSLGHEAARSEKPDAV